MTMRLSDIDAVRKASKDRESNIRAFRAIQEGPIAIKITEADAVMLGAGWTFRLSAEDREYNQIMTLLRAAAIRRVAEGEEQLRAMGVAADA